MLRLFSLSSTGSNLVIETVWKTEFDPLYMARWWEKVVFFHTETNTQEGGSNLTKLIVDLIDEKAYITSRVCKRGMGFHVLYAVHYTVLSQTFSWAHGRVSQLSLPCTALSKMQNKDTWNITRWNGHLALFQEEPVPWKGPRRKMGEKKAVWVVDWNKC